MRAVVSGASGGIGSATARLLASHGFDVCVHYRDGAEAARSLAEEIRAMGRDAFLAQADLSRPGAAQQLADAVLSRWDSLDALVHNAGDYPRQAFESTTDAEFERLFRVHVVSPAALTRALLPALRRTARGRIVFVSSQLAFSGSRRGAPYATAKAAQLGLARSLARELAPEITVNAVAPGAIDTAILGGDTPERRAERVQEIPLHRLGTAEEVAAAIAFLCSPEAGFLTATTLHVNGGSRPE